MKILISAGHNPATDSGAIGQGVKEADRNIRISDRVVLYLRSWGIDTDYMPNNVGNLQAEINWTNARYSDNDQSYCIQIHTNAGGGTGNEVWSTAYKNQMVLATSISKALSEANGLRNRGAKDVKKYSPLGWILNLKAQAVLIEARFIDVDNMSVSGDMVDAYGIACGVADFLKVPRQPSMEQQQIADAEIARQAQLQAKAEADRLAFIAEKARVEALRLAELKRLADIEVAKAEALAKIALEEKIAADQAKAEAEQALKDAVKTENDNFTEWLKNVFIIVANWLTSWRK